MSSLWRGQFGRKYTDRNPTCAAAVDTHYRKTFGITRTALNEQFLQRVPLDARILEVGCNVGAQLDVLREMGYTNLYGIEPMEYAVDKAANPNITQGYANAMQFSDDAFDLVFTSGVLIHINPAEIHKAMREIVRVSKRWVWGWEYYSDEYKAVMYRGEDDALWKADFANIYASLFSELALMQEVQVPYKEGEDIDTMYMLEQGGPYDE